MFQLHFQSPLITFLQYIAQRQLQAETRNIWVLGFGASYIRDFKVDYRLLSVQGQAIFWM